MINDENQDVDFENNEDEVVEVEDETTEEAEEDSTDWKAEALKYKAILDRNKTKKADEKPASKSNDFGYDVKAYLKASGIKADEFDFVKAELKASGMKDIDALLENSYFTDRLEKHRELTKTQDATPTGKRSGGVPTDSVEYWLGKPIEEVPSNMRIKVVNARLKQDESKGMFYNS